MFSFSYNLLKPHWAGMRSWRSFYEAAKCTNSVSCTRGLLAACPSSKKRFQTMHVSWATWESTRHDVGCCLVLSRLVPAVYADCYRHELHTFQTECISIRTRPAKKISSHPPFHPHRYRWSHKTYGVSVQTYVGGQNYKCTDEALVEPSWVAVGPVVLL